MKKSAVLDFITYLHKHFDYIELVGGNVEYNGNSHDEPWEDYYYLIDDKYKDYFDIDNQIKKSNKDYGGWGHAVYERLTDPDWLLTAYIETYYLRIHDTYYSWIARYHSDKLNLRKVYPRDAAENEAKTDDEFRTDADVELQADAEDAIEVEIVLESAVRVAATNKTEIRSAAAFVAADIEAGAVAETADAVDAIDTTDTEAGAVLEFEAESGAAVEAETKADEIAETVVHQMEELWDKAPMEEPEQTEFYEYSKNLIQAIVDKQHE